MKVCVNNKLSKWMLIICKRKKMFLFLINKKKILIFDNNRWKDFFLLVYVYLVLNYLIMLYVDKR